MGISVKFYLKLHNTGSRSSSDGYFSEIITLEHLSESIFDKLRNADVSKYLEPDLEHIYNQL